MSTSNGAETLDFEIARKTFRGVVAKFLRFLRKICSRIKRGNDVQINERKFDAVKKELFDYLVEHSEYFNMKYIITILKSGTKEEVGTSGNMIIFYYSRSLEEFLPLDYFLKYFDTHVKLKNSPTELEHRFCIRVEKHKIRNKVKMVLKKRNIANCDLNMFFKNHYLVSESKFLHYKEMYDFIDERISSYRNVSESFYQAN